MVKSAFLGYDVKPNQCYYQLMDKGCRRWSVCAQYSIPTKVAFLIFHWLRSVLLLTPSVKLTTISLNAVEYWANWEYEYAATLNRYEHDRFVLLFLTFIIKHLISYLKIRCYLMEPMRFITMVPNCRMEYIYNMWYMKLP